MRSFATRAVAVLAGTMSGFVAVPPAIGQQGTDRPSLDWSFDAAPGRETFTTRFPQPDFVPGVTGRAWRSDGFSSSVSAPLTLSATSGFTVSAWVALESYPSGYETPVADMIPASLVQQATKNDGFDIYVTPFGRWGMRVATTSGVVRVEAKEPFPLNEWTHVAGSYDPATGRAALYRNGVAVAEHSARRPAPFRPATADFTIARSWRPAPLGVFNINGVNGAYDDVRVTGTALAPGQVARMAGAVTPPPARPSLTVPASRFAADLQRPRYHAMPPANWTNEPHGLVRRGDTWHIFYQRTPNGPYKTLMTWGHMKSDDLVHWTDLPIALYPELQTRDFGFDMKGIWSGDVVNGPGGVGLAFYTSVNQSPNFYNPGISMAISEDADLLRWRKAGPLIDRTGVADFRDPYVWFEGGEARMIVGAALGGSGGLAYYRCADLADRRCWKRQPDFAPFAKMDIGSEIWEMPVFEKIGADKYILEVNPIGGRVSKYGDPTTRAVYWIGTWDGVRFTPDDVTPRMLDVLPGHLSPTVERDAAGRLVGIGIVDERRTPEAQLKAGWAHTFSLPRVWRLMPDGKTLGQSPLPALEKLRRTEGAVDRMVAGSGDTAIGDLGRMAEVEVRFDTPAATGQYGVTLAASADGREGTRLYYDADRREMVLDRRSATLATDQEGPQVQRGAYDEAAFGKPVTFRVFVDHSVVDVFINDAAAFSFRLYPTLPDASRIGVLSSGPVSARVRAWRLAPAPIG